MPSQLIFTSASQGLAAGRSGFCTVARHRAIPDRLTQLLENIGTPHESTEGETFTFRELEAGGKNWYVLSRFVAHGLDYTQRDNRLAHHLIFSGEEAAFLPPPASIAGRWKGWRNEWSGTPTWLEGEDKPLALENQVPLIPATTWRESTGTGAKAAWLINASGPASLSLLNPPETIRLLRLLAESSALIGKAAWAATFTTDTSLTGSDGFIWAVGPAHGRATIDFATAATLPAPTGDFARQAAVGVSKPGILPSGNQNQSRPAAPDKSGANSSLGLWIGLAVILTFGAVAAVLLSGRNKETPPVAATPTPARPAPSPADTAKTDDILRANRALTDVQSLMESDDYLAAAKLWLETAKLSPTFARNYREQILPRILSHFAASTSKQLLASLERPGILNDPKTCQVVAADAEEALRIIEELKAPHDEDWKRLAAIAPRARDLLTIDVRPVIIISGQWGSSDTGAKGASQADFRLSLRAADQITRFIEASGATTREAVTASIRLLPLTSFHLRDDKTKFIPAEIRRDRQSSAIESTPQPGRDPAIAISVGTRKNSVELNLLDGEGARTDANRLIEVKLANGTRQCFALVADQTSLKPLNLGASGLRLDTDTGVVRPSNWTESAVNSFVWINGAIGLFPAGHEFPDRDLPSVRATRSVLETDIIRLESKQGPDAPLYEAIAARRKLFKGGDYLQAGAPWVIQAINAQGTAGPRLLEFR